MLQDVQLVPAIEQVEQVAVQVTQVEEEESQYLVVAQVQNPVTESTICVADGQVAQAVPLAHVAHEE